MRFWEILEKDSGEMSRRSGMSHKESNDALEKAFLCGHKEGYKAGYKDAGKEMHGRTTSYRKYMEEEDED